ncbi:MAG: acyltransferase domain-containing protein, partial [Phycisphaerae bacterium]|nr:acyltransferase domain-containing protein [Phycisphaerae bacterium]
VYPIPVFTDEARQANEDRLRETQTAQPALGAVCLGAWRVLESFGVGGDAFAGHSFGELTALCAAGRLAGDDLAQLATRRGQLMAEAGGNGGMLAVGMSRPEVESWLARSGLPLVIANHNTPEQVVLSGARDAVEAAANRLQAENVAVKILAVSAAFHSPQVAAAARPLAETLAQVEMPGGRAEVYGNSTAAPYPTEVAAARDLLAGQLAKPVRFVEMIERMYADGVRCFLEVGPAAQISGLVTAILGDRDCQTIAVEPSKGKRHGIFDFAMALGQLAATGTKIHLDRWDPDFRLPAAPSRPGMSVRLTGANYVSPRTPKPPRPQPAPSPQAMSQPTPPPPSPAPRPAPADPAAAAGLQQSIAALSNLQEQTAQLHRQYLEGQAQAQETIGQLILQQHRLLGLPTVEPPATAPAVAPAPIAPVVPAPPAPVTPTIEAPSPPPVSPAPIEQAAPAPAPASPTPSAASGVLLNVVSEKTGYPAEMLELDMSLDTDLGIDSIKRVEILSALQEALPDAPTVKPEQLGTLQTLRQIVEFLDGGAAPAVQASASAPAPAISVVAEPATAATATDGSAADVLLKVVAEKTGYPAEMLELDMSLDTDLGIDSIKRVEILSALQEALPHAPTVKPEQLGTLQTLRQIVEFLGGGASPNETPPVTAPVVTTTTLADPAPAPSPAAAPSPLLRRLVLQARALNPETTSADARFPASASILVTDDDAGLAQAVCHELEQRGADPRRISITDRP